MLTIRKEQEEVLAGYMAKNFQERIVKHVKRFWPEQCRALGDEQVRESVRTGLARARGYGMSTEYDLARYIDLMYWLGTDFDTGPSFPWAVQILPNTSIAARAGMDKLYHTAEE